jgi:hypothetical protein
MQKQKYLPKIQFQGLQKQNFLPEIQFQVPYFICSKGAAAYLSHLVVSLHLQSLSSLPPPQQQPRSYCLFISFYTVFFLVHPFI